MPYFMNWMYAGIAYSKTKLIMSSKFQIYSVQRISFVSIKSSTSKFYYCVSIMEQVWYFLIPEEMVWAIFKQNHKGAA
jgi:hypothetical protein